jgi:disulfide oxidoreductase YuzD
LDLTYAQIQDISPLQNLTQLHTLILSKNQIQDISSLQNLTLLNHLDLRSNQIKDISSLQNLNQLIRLDLRSNQIQDISVLQNLTQLHNLDLSSNQIQDISPLLHLIKNGLGVSISESFNNINFANNPIIVPPINIIKQGNEAIIRFFENLLETKYEGKLLIVGEPEAGKTTLRNRLMIPGYKVPSDTTSTVGIQVDKWTPKKPRSRGKVMDINIWDFGGQEIQYMTHQFFLTPDALYVLLTSARKDLDNLDYWFNIIRLLGKNEHNQHSKLMVVANEINMKKVTHFVEKDFKARYPDLDFECYHVNFATEKNKDGRFNDLVNHIKENLALLPSMGRPLPVKWGVVRARLAQMKENSISIDRYLQICADAELDKDSAYDLSGYLHTVGEAIHFRNDRQVNDFIILKPKWAVDAVYVILKNEAIKNGHFTEKQVYEIWKKNGYPEDEWSRLLRLMAKDNFEVSYPLPDRKNDFIAPQLLADNPPGYDWQSDDTLKFRYSYAFMPKGILTRFIVRMHEEIAYVNNSGLVWKNGVVLKDEDMDYMAQVRETKIQEPGLERKVIDIEIMGEKGHRKSLLKKVCRNIEKIHNEIFTGLAFERLVPCNCIDCAGTENPTFYDYSELVELYKEGLDARCRKTKLKEVNITDIFEEIVDIDWKFKYAKGSLEGRSGLIINEPLDPFTLHDPFQATQKDRKVFFSYAWADDKETVTSREAIVNQLYESLKSDNFEVVRDKVDLGYKGSISDFMRTIGRGDCVIVAISDKYLRSPNCMFELYEAFRNSRLEKAAFVEKIIPIRVEEINLSPTARGEYRKYWNEKKTAWNEYMRNHSDDTSASEKEEQLRVKAIVDNLGTIFEILNDINSSTKELLSRDDFAEIKKAIKKIQRGR